MSYWSVGYTQSPWFTIFIDLDQGFAQGLTQVLYSMAVIELAKPGESEILSLIQQTNLSFYELFSLHYGGMEATTYELIVTVGNAAITLNGVICTQLLYPFKASGCTDDDCPSDTVQVCSTSFSSLMLDLFL